MTAVAEVDGVAAAMTVGKRGWNWSWRVKGIGGGGGGVRRAGSGHSCVFGAPITVSSLGSDCHQRLALASSATIFPHAITAVAGGGPHQCPHQRPLQCPPFPHLAAQAPPEIDGTDRV